jgi:L-seryl-tRNA(Ser) seleniumtransferase
MAGLLAAIEWSLAQDEPAALARYEERVQFWIDGLAGIPGITAERRYPSEAGQPHGRTLVTFGPNAAISRDAAIDALWDRNPRIAVSPVGDDAIALNPQTIEDGEEAIVLEAVREVLGGKDGKTATIPKVETMG